MELGIPRMVVRSISWVTHLVGLWLVLGVFYGQIFFASYQFIKAITIKHEIDSHALAQKHQPTLTLTISEVLQAVFGYQITAPHVLRGLP